MATVTISTPEPHRQPGWTMMFFDLRRELMSCSTERQLRLWLLQSSIRRNALSPEARAEMANLVAHRQQRLAITDPEPKESMQGGHVGLVMRRLLDTLNASAKFLTPTEARDFADSIRNTAAFHTPTTISAEVQ